MLTDDFQSYEVKQHFTFQEFLLSRVQYYVPDDEYAYDIFTITNGQKTEV